MSLAEDGDGTGQLFVHRAKRVDLPGRHGPIAALATEFASATVLLVPGYTGSKEDFAPLLDGIAAAGLRAIAVDLPGQFESAGPPRRGGPPPTCPASSNRRPPPTSRPTCLPLSARLSPASPRRWRRGGGRSCCSGI